MSAQRRGATDLSGILIVDKPTGITSHDVVSAVRRATGERRVGHAGTLDPSATGVLVVLVGPATRLTPLLTAARKSYDACVVFGTRTDTDDAEGSAVEEVEPPPSCTDPDVAARVVAGLKGVTEQTPPSFSAIKRDGQISHRAARAGRPVELEPRTIEVFDAVFTGIDTGPPITWCMSLTVSKGTYIRAIARDLGHSLGTAAHLGALRRTASGTALLSAAHTLDDISDAAECRILFADPVSLLDLPVLEVDDRTAARVRDGVAIEFSRDDPPFSHDERVAVVHANRLLAVYRAGASGGTLTADVVLPGGISR